MSYDEIDDDKKVQNEAAYPYIFIYYSPALYSNIYSNLKWKNLEVGEKFSQSLKLMLNTLISIFKYCERNYGEQNCLVMVRGLAMLAQTDIEGLAQRVEKGKLDFEIFSISENLISLKV